ncbi:MAG: nucleotidyltransferase [Verrucomicrobia bacterium]|nr:nucleotidyltransferase [Pseudomonadota bacterium]NBS05936.1 nucleotidyltransferase [Verrucomicrobiota bacterium]NBS78328.1 nucleotidyltransferase [bacterium]NBS49271.1 nucleotidyltransferase [Verrucomicrobiota bacterium]NBT23098.1 nucleotidyltransferase [bacterium]
MAARLSLLVMAAGMGSRYGGLKQLDPVGPGGEVLLDYAVYDAKQAGLDRVVFLIRKDLETDFRKAIGKRYEGKIEVEYAFQELDDLPPGFVLPDGRKKPWGTGQAILAAGSVIRGGFVAINADDFYGRESYRLLYRHLTSPAGEGRGEFSMAGFRLDQTLSDHGTVTRGVCQSDANGFLVGVEEYFDLHPEGSKVKGRNQSGQERAFSGQDSVSMNCWGFNASIFPMLQEGFEAFLQQAGTHEKSEYLIPNAVGGWIREGKARVRVLPTSEKWAGMTYPEDKQRVADYLKGLVARGVYPNPLF